MAAIALSAKVAPRNVEGTHILRLTTERRRAAGDRDQTALLVGVGEPENQGGEEFRCTGRGGGGAIQLPSDYAYLADGDIIRWIPKTGDLRVLYRRSSRHNILFVTEQCNSRCVMCSQPPRDIDDNHLIEEILQMIPLMAPETSQLCITGGEPTLNFKGLLRIMASVREHLPQTSLHMLSNGRSFRNRTYARALAAIRHEDFMTGIPLYSDQSSHHDFVVQSKGAFDETVEGLLNLAAYQQKIEIRFVIHRLTVSRMVGTARFIARNFPFVSHVALMGLEPTGFGKTNLEALWIDPWDYRCELEEAVLLLSEAGIKVSIYNHQLCVLKRKSWSIAIKSISDWKIFSLRDVRYVLLEINVRAYFRQTNPASVVAFIQSEFLLIKKICRLIRLQKL